MSVVGRAGSLTLVKDEEEFRIVWIWWKSRNRGLGLVKRIPTSLCNKGIPMFFRFTALSMTICAITLTIKGGGVRGGKSTMFNFSQRWTRVKEMDFDFVKQ